MLIQYRLTLRANQPGQPAWACLLYASLLAGFPMKSGKNGIRTDGPRVIKHTVAVSQRYVCFFTYSPKLSASGLPNPLTAKNVMWYNFQKKMGGTGMNRKREEPLTPEAYLSILKSAMQQAEALSEEELAAQEVSTRIFFKSRNMVPLTQDNLKPISAQMMSNIETGKRIPTPDDVLILARATRNPTLLGYYCTVYCSLNYIPREYRMSTFSVEEAKQQIESGFQELETGIAQLLEALKDSRIDKDEFHCFFSALDTLKQISGAIHGLRNWAALHHPLPLTLTPSESSGTKLSDLRKDANETQETAADLIHVSRTFFISLEKNFDKTALSLSQNPDTRNRFNILADHYHSPALYETFCRLPHQTGSLADVACGFLTQAILLQREKTVSSLTQILADNVVGSEEQETFLDCMERLKSFCDYTDSMIHWGQRFLTRCLRTYMEEFRRRDFTNLESAMRCIQKLKDLGYSKKYTEKYLEEIQQIKKKARHTLGERGAVLDTR